MHPANDIPTTQRVQSPTAPGRLEVHPFFVQTGRVFPRQMPRRGHSYASTFATRRPRPKPTRFLLADIMKIRFAIIAAWAGTFAPVQTDLAQAAYPVSDVSKRTEMTAEVGIRANNRAPGPISHHSQISFKTEVREFEFPYGIIINQRGLRDGRRPYNHSQSYPVDAPNRHSCYNSTGGCARWNEVHPPRHHHRPYSRVHLKKMRN
jgi:hypothetical protein